MAFEEFLSAGKIDRFETIQSKGTLTFSIFNTTTKQIVYNSGDDNEHYTAAN